MFDSLRKISFWWNVSPKYCANKIIHKFFEECRVDTPLSVCRALQKEVYSWLESLYSKELAEWEELSETTVIDGGFSGLPIWFCWLQGSDDMPELQRQLMERIRRQAGKHPVRFVDIDELKRLDIIPKYAFEAFESGRIRPALFSDLVRVSLLDEFGGIWMDSSIFAARPVPDWCGQFVFLAPKGLNPYPYERYVPFGNEWQSYFLCSYPHALFVHLMREMILEYIKKEYPVIDYFLVFYFAKLLRSKIPVIFDEYKELPDNNEDCELLHLSLCDSNEECIRKKPYFSKSNTFIYKLNRRISYDTDILRLVGEWF